MADAIRLVIVDDNHCIGFGDGRRTPDVLYINPLVGEDQMRGVGSLFGAFLPAGTRADDVPDRQGVCGEKLARLKLGQVGWLRSATLNVRRPPLW
jgi:hypothetical protein